MSIKIAQYSKTLKAGFRIICAGFDRRLQVRLSQCSHYLLFSGKGSKVKRVEECSLSQ